MGSLWASARTDSLTHSLTISKGFPHTPYGPSHWLEGTTDEDSCPLSHQPTDPSLLHDPPSYTEEDTARLAMASHSHSGSHLECPLCGNAARDGGLACSGCVADTLHYKQQVRAGVPCVFVGCGMCMMWTDWMRGLVRAWWLWEPSRRSTVSQLCASIDKIDRLTPSPLSPPPKGNRLQKSIVARRLRPGPSRPRVPAARHGGAAGHHVPDSAARGGEGAAAAGKKHNMWSVIWGR